MIELVLVIPSRMEKETLGETRDKMGGPPSIAEAGKRNG